MTDVVLPRTKAAVAMPGWVPEGVMHYLAHTELGQPIRVLARMAGCHASTVMRQIRKVETRRDDFLVDGALRRLGRVQQQRMKRETRDHTAAPTADIQLPDDDTLNREGLRILRRLCETGAVLAVAAEMEKAVVVRDTAAGGTARTAVVAADIAQAMALKDWIAPANQGRIVRYHITTAGRTALSALLEDGDLVQHQAVQAEHVDIPFKGTIGEDQAHDEPDAVLAEPTKTRRMRYSLAESPLIALSRRRDHTGAPFLSDALVCAGEQLREDFELGQMQPGVAQNWDTFLVAGVKSGGAGADGPSDAPSRARLRVAAAMAELGPGLSDVVMRCCCYLEGLETTERRLGWSARSGKIVLRIALMRLQRHYEVAHGPGGPMIG